MIKNNWSRITAWGVHVFTASGLLAGLMAIIAISAEDWRKAMAWLLVALVIDGIDGTLARMFRVKEILPNVNGKTIDTVVDFTNYAVIPAYFIYAANLGGPFWSLPLAILVILVSAVYYGRDGMVSDDFYFIGFPVMWNVVIFYLVFVFPPSGPPSLAPSLNLALIPIFAILHFVPIKFAYPSRATSLKIPTIVATVTMLLLMPVIVWLYPNVPVWLRLLAIVNLAYFGILAVYDTFIVRRRGSARGREGGRA